NLELPFGKLIDELKPPTDLSRHPVFQIAFIYLDFPEEIGVETIRVTSESLEVDNGSSRVDMTLALTERPVRLESQIEYNTDLFEGATIRRLLNHWRNMVAALVDDPDLPISDVPLMGEGEVRELLEDYNRSSVPFPDRSCVHELFDLQAGRRPEAVALLHENQHVTYGHLWARADSLSRLLKRMGVRADCCVGICMERSINMVVSLLAVLKAGGAYVPIDLSHPAARLRFIAADSKIELVLTSSGMLDTVSTNFDRFLCVAQAAGQDDCEDSGDANQSRPFPESLAYVVYTSGTTGLPKGVAVTHQGIVRLVRNANYACLDDQQVFLQLCRLSFDPATIEIWGCLLNGAKLVLMPGERTAIEDIYRTVSLHGVTTLLLPAALFHLMVDRGPEALYSVCQLLVGGEALQADHVNRFLGGAGPGRLINAYGPAEVTTNTCFHRFDRPVDPSRPVPIGRPISNTSVYILDRSLNPVPTGVKGQIFASGRGLARGYLNNADLTAERFGPNPFSRLIGDRLYSTGDLGRYLKCGNIEFLGRMDYQIKLRGFRIELGEIESMIASAANVSTVVVVLRTDHSGEKRLLAYATPKPGATLTPSQLRDRARSSLPVYMVPSSFVVLDTLPLTSS
ncbi:MAG TPA: amino acid adenylation domain-containing protein, partial [Blastocatellia bacterium]|nr:amino acid adenylation domain-containing protein [Blastocatellia bacterium]